MLIRLKCRPSENCCRAVMGLGWWGWAKRDQAEMGLTCWPPISNKMEWKWIYFEALPRQICLIILQLIGVILLCILCKFEANWFRQSFEKIHFYPILFDVGDPQYVMWLADVPVRDLERIDILEHFSYPTPSSQTHPTPLLCLWCHIMS